MDNLLSNPIIVGMLNVLVGTAGGMAHFLGTKRKVTWRSIIQVLLYYACIGIIATTWVMPKVKENPTYAYYSITATAVIGLLGLQATDVAAIFLPGLRKKLGLPEDKPKSDDK